MGSRAAVDLCGGAVVALLVGYALSVFSGSPIGLYSFIYVLLFLSVRFLKTFFVLQKISLLVLLVAVSCVVEWVCVVLLLYIFHKISLSAVSFKAILLWQTFYTTLLAPVLLLVFQYIYNTTLQGSWVHLVRRLVLPHNDWGGNR
jgi:cell shape-determining protein MreD